MRGYYFYFIVFGLLVAGCRILPQKNGLPGAHELRVGQLLILSDFELRENSPLVRELAAEREDICRTLSLPSSDRIIHVYLFQDAETYGKYLARHFASLPQRRAFFLESDSKLAVYAHASDRVAEDLRHEVAHGYLHSIVPNLPLWLDEGLAEFFEVPRGQHGLNRPHLDLISDMMQHENWRPDMVKLEQLAHAAQMEQLHYAESWAWVYFLLHSDPERRALLTDYLAELRKGAPTVPLSQWLAQNGVHPQQLLGEYLVGLKQGAMLR